MMASHYKSDYQYHIYSVVLIEYHTAGNMSRHVTLSHYPDGELRGHLSYYNNPHQQMGQQIYIL